MHLKSEKRGDTLIEVVLAFAMFSLVAVVSIAVMNSSISGAEASLELSLARTEIDSQAETLRFVHEAFANNSEYANLWNRITEQKADPAKLPKLDATNCDDLYYDNTGNTIYTAKAFVVNPRYVVNGNEAGKPDYYENTLIRAVENSATTPPFRPAVVNPRVIYINDQTNLDGTPKTSDDVFAESDDDDLSMDYIHVGAIEGIYDMVLEDSDSSAPKPRHYDFYVYTCWMPSGAKRPTTIGTVLRLFNPEYVSL